MFDETRNELLYHNKKLPSRSRCVATTMSECGEDLHYQAKSSSLQCPVPGRISVHECQLPQDFEWRFNVDEHKFSTAHNTPRLGNCMLANNTPATTPLKSACGDKYYTFRPYYSNFPNYMTNTHSSKAKLRSQSAPKQRPELKKRSTLSEIMATRNSISNVRMQWSSNPQTQDYCYF